jgi:RNA polymerase sigma-70 factor, ECF subfamily
MSMRSQHEVTQLLHAWRAGEQSALDRLLPLVQDELRRLAHIYMVRERPGHILQTSALINEAYLRLIDANRVDWQDRSHFFAISANLMRQVLMQDARLRCARKRGGGGPVRVELDEACIPSPGRDRELVALDDALNSLEKADPREAKVVELRYFGGLSEPEIAQVLGISERTVRREWEHAKAWILHEMKHGAEV